MEQNIILGVVGILIISYAFWLKNERTKDKLFLVGTIILLSYSILVEDIVFITLQIILIISIIASLIMKRGKKK